MERPHSLEKAQAAGGGVGVGGRWGTFVRDELKALLSSAESMLSVQLKVRAWICRGP